MQMHSEHLRHSIDDYSGFESKYQFETLLNCGIFGGNINIVSTFIDRLWQIHQKYNLRNNSKYTGDMGAFNYLVRTKYNHQVMHGSPINTVFKTYDNDNQICWFRHK